jgi:diguanylate cyclase (GGDEF)-like protein
MFRSAMSPGARPAGPRMPRTIGEISIPMDVLRAGTPITGVEGHGVLVGSDHGLRLITRDRELAPAPISADTDIDRAAEAAMSRTPADRNEPLLVSWPDGRYGIAPMMDLLTATTGRHARLARVDPLTNLPNRDQAIAEGRRRLADGTLAAVLHVGLDRFRDVNDMLGRPAADVLLQRVALTLGAACRATDLIARIEGDQFLVLLSTPSPAPGLLGIGRRLAAALRGPHTVNEIPVGIEASIGVSDAGSRDIGVVLRQAEDAMRSAKRERTGVALWACGVDSAHRADLRQLTELRTGIKAGRMRLHYQPLHDATTREIRGVEALVRWQHPQRGLLPPGLFLPDAERSDVILELTDWVLAEAIHQAAVWHREGASMPVSVNISAAYLARDRAVPTILALLNLEKLPPSLLTIEMTETAVLTRPDRAAARLAMIRAAGIRISIDDFGTGYTSLGLLPEFPIDELKIDRSFVVRLHDSKPHATIIDAVVSIARSLNVSVVAEGVEDEPAAATLAAAGVDLLQGFHLNRPVPPADLPLSG